MSTYDKIKVDKILEAVGALRLNTVESSTLSGEFDGLKMTGSDDDYYYLAKFICDERATKIFGSYAPAIRLARILKNRGLDEPPEQEAKEVFVPFFAGGI